MECIDCIVFVMDMECHGVNSHAWLVGIIVQVASSSR